MLSKLYHLRDYKNISSPDMNSLLSELDFLFKEQERPFILSKFTSGGTLGLFFTGTLNSKNYFFKTHYPENPHKDNLEKEISILKKIYRDSLYIDSAELRINKDSFTILIMDKLSLLLETPTQKEITQIIREYQKKTNLSSSKGFYTFEDLLSKSEEGLEVLLSQNLIGKETYQDCHFHINSITKMEYKEVLCHGDLSNKNILLKGKEKIVIDWEDAFLGPPCYDYCYWLSFFDQRRYYGPSMFNTIDISFNTGISFMTIILLLKSYLSYLNGSYLNNKLSIEERLQEILIIKS